MIAVAKDAMNRASTSAGSPGKATNVETNTMGLIAGAASRNVRADEAGTPFETSEPATGTDAHSQPGSSIPAQPETGTANALFFGSTRCHTLAGINAVTAPESSTPPTRNGIACTTIETKIVDAVCSAGLVKNVTIHCWPTTSAMRPMIRISREPIRQRLFLCGASTT